MKINQVVINLTILIPVMSLEIWLTSLCPGRQNRFVYVPLQRFASRSPPVIPYTRFEQCTLGCS